MCHLMVFDLANTKDAWPSLKFSTELFFAGIAQLGDDLLPEHFAAVIKDFNQAGAGSASVGNGRGKLRGGKNADDLPLVFSSLDPEFVLLPLGHC